MKSYKYVAIDSSGETHGGEVSARNVDTVIMMLRRDDLTIIDVYSPSDRPGILQRISGFLMTLFGVKERIDERTVILFTRQFSTLIGAGINILRSLRSILIVEQDRKFKKVISGILMALREGFSISGALAKFPFVFSEVYIGIVKVGETSGRLSEAFRTIAQDLEKSYSFKQKTVAILTYPAAVLIFSLVIILLMFIYFVPSFTGIYDKVNMELPLCTLIVIKVGKCILDPVFWLYALIISAVAIFLAQSYIRTPVGRFTYDSMKLRLPIFGELITKRYLYQVFLNLACMLEYGVYMNEALTKIKEISQNTILKYHMEEVYQKVRQGDDLSEAMSAIWFVPRFAVDFIMTGEATGTMADMLRKSSEVIEQELLQRVETLLAMFEPLVISLLSVVLGFIIIATFLPLYNLIKVLS
ncbi:MAG: type II secretion system F family protein [Candidatus Eremiobacteraeota bacterium]|nr:type II secretion system F family protein [Candidatus Eremiobacteraeota bacterium]